MTVTLETPRLLLRPWRPQDIDPMAAINADSAVMRWIGDGSVRTLSQSREAMAAWRKE